MTKKITNLLGIIITILAGTFFYLKLCSSCDKPLLEDPLKDTAAVSVTPQPTSYPFEFSKGANGYSANDNYNFNVSSPSILTPISQQVLDGISTLRAVLANRNGSIITITGYFSVEETNISAIPNLGLARANMVKEHMVENGILASQINTTGEFMADLVPIDNVYLGPITYSIGIQTEDPDNSRTLISLNR